MVLTFADMAAVEASPYKPGELYVRIGDEPVRATEAHTVHDVDQPVGTCRVMLALPRLEALQIGANIEVEMGHPGTVGRVFLGFVPDDDASITDTEQTVTVNGEGWGAFLRDEDAYGLLFNGPVSLKDVFRGVCESRFVPTYLADETTLPDGSQIMLGGNEQVDGGDVVIDDRSSPGSFLSRTAQLFGYRTYDIPNATHRLSRVSGLPNPQFEGGELTIELATGDYVQATSTLNLRTGPGTGFEAIAALANGGYGRIDSDTDVIADGFRWRKIRAFGAPTAWVAITSFAGEPRFLRVTPTQPIHWVTEGVNAYRFDHQRSSKEMRTYFDVRGARYTDPVDGGPVEIRSIPNVVPSAPELRPLGYRIERFSDQALVTTELAEGCRACLEVDQSALYERHGWEQHGNPEMMPGQIAVVTSATLGIWNALRWIMRVEHDFTSDAFTTTVEGWAGGGVALPAGDDCRTETVTNDTIHAGTETLSHYRDPSPDSVRDPRETDKETKDRRWVVEIPFTVSYADYSSLKLTGICHGSNSIKNKTAITGSQIEVWQLEDPAAAESGTNEFKRVGTMELPTANEELSKKRNYSSTDRFWTPFSLPLPGSLKLGAATLVIVCGESKDGEIDDFEVGRLRLIYCGVGIPALPGSTEVA